MDDLNSINPILYEIKAINSNHFIENSNTLLLEEDRLANFDEYIFGERKQKLFKKLINYLNERFNKDIFVFLELFKVHNIFRIWIENFKTPHISINKIKKLEAKKLC